MPNYKQVLQEMTELNSDGNESRGRYVEDFRAQKVWIDDDKYLSDYELQKKRQAQDTSHNQF